MTSKKHFGKQTGRPVTHELPTPAGGVRLETFVPLQFKRKKGKLLVDGRESAHDVRIVEAVARAMHWHALLDTGAFKSVVEIAKAEDLMPTTVGRLLRLVRLAPDIIEQLMQGCQPRRLTLLWLMRNDIPALWPEQRQMLERFR